MVYKTIIGVFLLACSLSAAALDEDECQAAAINIYAAQNMLNEDKELFNSTTERIKKAAPEELGWSPFLKQYVMSIVSKLKQGTDPIVSGQDAYDKCPRGKSV